MSWYVMVWPGASSHDITTLFLFVLKHQHQQPRTNHQQPRTKNQQPRIKKPKNQKPKTRHQKLKKKKKKSKNQKIKKSKKTKNQIKNQKSKSQKVKKSKNQNQNQKPTFVHACIFLFLGGRRERRLTTTVSFLHALYRRVPLPADGLS